jgi:hypothetical protein
MITKLTNDTRCTVPCTLLTVPARRSALTSTQACQGEATCNVVAVQVVVFDSDDLLLDELCHSHTHAVTNVLNDCLTCRFEGQIYSGNLRILLKEVFVVFLAAILNVERPAAAH